MQIRIEYNHPDKISNIDKQTQIFTKITKETYVKQQYTTLTQNTCILNQYKSIEQTITYHEWFSFPLIYMLLPFDWLIYPHMLKLFQYTVVIHWYPTNVANMQSVLDFKNVIFNREKCMQNRVEAFTDNPNLNHIMKS